MATEPPQADYNEIVRGLSLIHFNETYEVRALTGIRGRADNGYFRDARTAANAIVNSDHGDRAGIYSTVNGVDPDCYARGADCITGQSGGYTSDKEVPLLNWLILDIDANRRSGISSTEGEKGRANVLALKLISDLNFMHGFPLLPMFVDSGNGYHVLYRLWSLLNNASNVALLQRVLKKLAEQYNDDGASVDITMFNPSRILRIPGTIARKGTHLPDRPHRRSCIIGEHDPFQGITRDQLLRIGGAEPPNLRNSVFGASYRYPPDETKWRQLNTDARNMTDMWVPQLLGHFNPRKNNKGYWKITSEALGRELEDNLYIGPHSIDFGIADQGDPLNGKWQPVTIIAEYVTNGNKEQAAQLLSECLGVPATGFDRLALGPPQGLPPVSAPGTPALPLDDATGGYKPAPLRFTPLSDIANMDALVRDPLIPNWVDGVALLAADPKTGKTFLGIQMAICVALGWPFLGSDIKEPCKVWYVALEDNEPNMAKRFKVVFRFLCLQLNQQWTPELEAYMASRINVHALGLEATDQMITLEGALPQFAQTLDANQDYQFVIVDPFLLIKGNTVAGDIVQQEYLNFRRLMVPFSIRGVRALVLHHTNKKGGGDNPMNALSGTQALRACAEVIHVMGKLKIGSAESDVISINTEMRNSEHDGLKYIKRIKHDNNTGFIQVSTNDAMAPIEQEIAMALAYIQSTSHTVQNANSIAKGAMLDAGRIFRILQVLIDRGEIDKYGEKYGVSGMDVPSRGSSGTPGKTGPDDVKWREMRDMVVSLLTSNPKGLSTAIITDHVNNHMDISSSMITKNLQRMTNENIIVKEGRGQYFLPNRRNLPDWL